jgi:hypothetical protein
MFNRNDEYKNATKNARINTYDNRENSVRVWFINFSLFSLLAIGSYYSYLYYNSTKSHATIVMGVSHTNASDSDLMVKLYDIKVDKLTVERDNLSISNAMKEIIDNSSVEDSSKYVEELALEVAKSSKSKIKKTTFEKRILDELKLIN